MTIGYSADLAYDWHSLMTSAFTVDITINVLPLEKVLEKAVAQYNHHNQKLIEARVKPAMEVGTGASLNAAVRWIRHYQTNYDELWTHFDTGEEQGQPWQIIFRRTMRLIEENYPELTPQVNAAVNHRLPAEVREIMCFPCPLEDVVKEVRETTLKLRKGYKPTPTGWRELLRNHVLMTRTDYRFLIKAYKNLPDEERLAKREQVRNEAMEVIHFAFPELTGDVSEYVREQSSTETPNTPQPLSVHDVSAEAAAPVEEASYDSGFRLEVIPLDRLLAQTIWAYNSTIQSPTQIVLDIEGDASMQAEIRLRSIAHLLNMNSSRGLLMGSLSSMPAGEAKRFMVRAVELAAHQAICRAYPELAKESEIELNRRLSGGKFEVPKERTPDPQPAPVIPVPVPSAPEPRDKAAEITRSLTFRPITLDELLKATIDQFNANPTNTRKYLSLDGGASMQKDIRSRAVLTLVNTRSNYPGLCSRLKKLPQDVSAELLQLDHDVHDRVASMFPELAIESFAAMHRRIANRKAKSGQKMA